MAVTAPETDSVQSPDGPGIPIHAPSPQARAWEDMVALHAPSVRRHALHLTGNQHDADDLTQDVFVRAFCTAATPRPNATACWLHRITTNLFIDSCRRRKRRPQDLLPDYCSESLIGGERDPADILDTRCLTGDVQAALDRLPLGVRSAIILRDVEALSYAEIAELLGLKLGTVRSHIHRGRDQLRVALVSREPRRMTQILGPTSHSDER